MSGNDKNSEKQLHDEEIKPKSVNGMPVLLLNILLSIVALVLFIWGIRSVSETMNVQGVIFITAGALYAFIIGPIIFVGLKVLKPKEALVLTLFGKYYGTLKGEGFFFVNPFVTAAYPSISNTSSGVVLPGAKNKEASANTASINKKISLKAMTLNNEKQKINDRLGNPIIIGIVVI